MSAPIDKPFSGSGPCQADVAFSPVAPSPASLVTPPAPGAVNLETGFPNPWGPYQITPDQTASIDLAVDQFLNLQALAFKLSGEEMLVYRQKHFGQTCACVDPATNQPQDGCRICFNTRFVGGYDLIGKTAGNIGPNPLARKLTEFGITLSQKPILTVLPNMVIRDRDFILAKARTPITDLIRFQSEAVTRGAVNADIDPLSMLNARKIIKISLTKDGSVLSTPNPQPISTVGNDYDLPAQAGGGEDFTEGIDFILTGGELAVDNALTSPPNADTRILRVLGKRAPLSPPDGETILGQTIPVNTLYVNAGLSAGLPASVFNRAAQPQAFTTTLTLGAGADAGFFLITLTGAVGSGISNSTAFPGADFLVTVAGSGVLWLTINRPVIASTYYVTYEAAINVTLRYQILNVSPNTFQGVVIAQQSDIDLMDQTHPIYGINSIYDLGAPLDRQVGNVDVIRKELGAVSGLVASAPNNSDPRFVNPADFLP